MLPGASNAGGIVLVRPAVDVGLHELDPDRQRREGALLLAAQRLLLVEADPHADGDVGSKPMNHASVLSSTVPVLPASGHWLARPAAEIAVPRSRTPRSRFVITNAVSARMTSVGSARFSSSRLPSRSFTRQDVERLHPDALIREHRVGARHLEQRRVAGAERNRQVRREVLFEAEPLGVGEHVLRPERVHHLDRRDVARLLERPPQRDRAFELVVVVLRAVDRPLPAG